MAGEIKNLWITGINSKYFSKRLVIPFSIVWRVFGNLGGNIRAARECHADDLSKDEFFDQHRRGQRKSQTADDYQTLQHRFHDYPPCPHRKKKQAESQS